MLKGLFSTCMPYVMKLQDDGGWLPLNRERKPLSFSSNEPIQSAAAGTLPTYKLPKKLLRELDVRGISFESAKLGDEIALYRDDNNPSHTNLDADWAEYFQRLRKISACKYQTPPDDGKTGA